MPLELRAAHLLPVVHLLLLVHLLLACRAQSPVACEHPLRFALSIDAVASVPLGRKLGAPSMVERPGSPSVALCRLTVD